MNFIIDFIIEGINKFFDLICYKYNDIGENMILVKIISSL